MEENNIKKNKGILSDLVLYKYCILTCFAVIFFVNLFLFLLYNGNAMLFVDTSRELYIPMAMNDGGVLYKDIFNVYAPFGYQLNAFFIRIFGEDINTFFNIGFVNSTLFLWGLFLLIRFFVKNSSFYAISIISFIAVSCLYCVSSVNYIFPYSYSLVFSLNAFIWSLVSALYFVKKDKNFYLYSAFFLYGVSVACKYEFCAFILVLAAICFYKKVSAKTIVISLILMFTVPLLSLVDLIIKGVTFDDLRLACINILLLSKAESTHTLYSYLGFIPSFNSLKISGLYFLKTSLFIVAIVCYFNLFDTFYKFLSKYLRNQVSLLITLIFGFIPLFVCFKFLIPILIESNAFYFSLIGIFTLILFLFKCRKILSENKYLFILFVSCILCSAKCIFNISFNSYGTYFFPLLFVCCILYFSQIAFKVCENEEKMLKIRSIFILLVLFLLFFISNYEKMKLVFENEKYDFYKGKIYPEKLYSESVFKTIRHIRENTNSRDTVLVLPEGAMINFFTDRKSHNKFYYLIPPNIEIFGEDNIVKELENDLPEYLVIQPMSFHNFNETYFCESFGKKICNLIPKYYHAPIVFGNEFWMAIYKKIEISEK